MKILVIHSRDLNKASTHFRIAQYEEFLKHHGIELQYIRRDAPKTELLARTKSVDLVFNQKCLLRASVARGILNSARRTLFDFDDAIYSKAGARAHSWFTSLRVRRRLGLWLRQADVVTTANQYLAGYAHRYRPQVEIVPMAIDMEWWRPRERISNNNKAGVVIGWTGAPVNVKNLLLIDNVLAKICSQFPSVRLVVFSGERPPLSCPYDYYPYQPGGEAEFVRRLDIGLLPLGADEFSKGKSPIKAIQYLSCAVPVIGNVHGASEEIINSENGILVSSLEQWEQGLVRLINDASLRKRLGEAGRNQVVKKFNKTVVSQQLLRILQS
jgi:glycosyltransferase involved in cell wall biosynthesis